MIHQPIFVFGSNIVGHHFGGAARFAFDYRGAEWGQAEGRQGESYAIPTCDERIYPLPLLSVANHVKKFIRYANENPTLRFEVTRIGCGIAGFKPEQIAPLFRGAPDSCGLPAGWRDGKEDAHVRAQ